MTKEAKRSESAIFAMFAESQIQEFKEVFTLLDQDRDGVLSVDDLMTMYQSLGREPEPKELKDMLKEMEGDPSFTSFLQMFGEKLHGSDPEDTIRAAFAIFDSDATGAIPEEYLKELLTEVGDPLSPAEIKQMWKEASVENGQFNYDKYVTKMKRGDDEEKK